MEGGWFRRTLHVRGNGRAAARCAGAGDGHLLPAGGGHLLEMHVLESDEMFHFYLGDPVEMLQLYPGRELGCLDPWSGFGGRSACAAAGAGGRLAGDAVDRGRQDGAAGMHGDTGVQLCGLPQSGKCAELAAQWPAQAERIRRLTRS